MSHFNFIPFFILLIFTLVLSNCNDNAVEQSQDKASSIELPPPPTIHHPSRPSKPTPEPDQQQVQQIPIRGAFATHPALEKVLNSSINNSLFPFSFDQPGEMAPPRQLIFSGVLTTSLTTTDFPIFEIQIWSNNTQDTDPIFTEQLSFEQEMQDTYSFQLTTTESIVSGLYYYLVKDEYGKLYYANKVIVDY